MKYIVSIFLAVAVLSSLSTCPPPARAGFGNFSYSDNYSPGQFSDVNESDWFSRYVQDAYNFGFFLNSDADTFNPNGFLTFGEAVELAVHLHRTYGEDSAAASIARSPSIGSPTGSYMEYALEHGIIEGSVSNADYSAPITRVQFAALICASLPKDALPEINSIPDYGICDVVEGMGFEEDVYVLYRAGIIAGTDQYGTFSPEQKITRAEACAIMVRLTDPLARVRAVPPARIPADVIYNRCMDAVFLLETFDKDGDSIRTGTGFFINSSGHAVTNLHVVDNAASAEVTLSSGDVFPVLGVVSYSEEFNLVVFSVDLNSTVSSGQSQTQSQSYLRISDSDRAVVGSTVYALGNPLAYVHTITNGVVANMHREVDGNLFFQFTAPISFGSGGSPVLNTLGQVVGVASSSYSYGQNLNLAVPSNLIKELEAGKFITLNELREIRAASAAIDD